MMSFQDTIRKLRSEGFKLTPQRLAVIRYMIGNKEHPAALKIHKDLKRKYPTISFSTVYNTLDVLEKIGEIKSLHIHDDYLNYEPNTDPHAHFICKKCGKIYDLIAEGLGNCHVPQDEINGHEITSCSIIFSGTCKNCR